MEPRGRRSASRALTAAKVAGVTSAGLLSLLLNPFLIGSVVAVAALVGGPKHREQGSRSPKRSSQVEQHGRASAGAAV